MTTTDAPPEYRSRRTTELFLLVFAGIISIGAYALVDIGVSDAPPANIVGYTLTLTVLFVGAHIAVRRFAPYADPLLLPAAVLLNGLGLALIHRLDLTGDEATPRVIGWFSPEGEAAAQLIWTFIGIGLFVAVLVLIRDHRQLQRWTYTAMAAGLVLLALPAILPNALAPEINGAKIWLRLLGFSIQPGEFAKIVLVVFFAGYLVVKRDVLALATRRFLGMDFPRGRDMGPILVAWAASLLILIRERDLGTSLLFFGVFVVMLYVATERTSWLVLGGAMFFGGAYVAYQLFGHVQRRVTIWLDPLDPNTIQNESFQLAQGLFGFATGGLLGTGLGEGRPDKVPAASTDFIVATAGEEIGLTGVMAILIVYALIVERGLRTCLTVRDAFGKLLAAGLAIILALQVVVVVGGVTQGLPLTGLTTPFLSYGGSSLVANWAIIALLLLISDAARRPAPLPTVTPDQEVTQVVKL